MSMIDSEPSTAEASPAPVRIRVNGTPVQQGSKNATVRGGKAVMYEAAAKKLTPWRTAVAKAARLQNPGHQPFVGPVIVEAVFSMPRPKSGEGARRPYPSVAPDLDKLTRAIGDALKTAASTSMTVR